MDKTKVNKIDKTLLFLIMAFIFVGLLILASASLVKSQREFQTNYYFLRHQFFYGALIGLSLLWFGAKMPYRFWQKISVIFFFISLALLFLVFLPEYGLSFGGAKRWVQIGNFNFQPSEIVKLAFVIYLSTWLSRRAESIKSFNQAVLPFIVLNAVLGILFLMQPDMGSLLIIYICSALLFFLAGARYKHLIILAITGLVALLLLIYISPYRFSRLTSFLNPEEDPLDASYQIRQSLIGIGSGGILGRGYGQSIQKKGYLPETIADSIFVVFVEEFGFVGAVFLIGGYFLVLFKGFRIAKAAPDSFGCLLAAGITILFCYQAFINIGAISGLVPLTGLTLPLISYGSSSYGVTLLSLGILLNISSYVKK